MTNFDINLLFEARIKPNDAFGQLSELFEALEKYDRWLVSILNRDYRPEYYIDSIEYASIKTRIAQVIRGIPDDAIADFDWKKLVGHFLLKAKYWLLKKLESKSEIQSVSDLSDIAKELEEDILKLSNLGSIIVSPSISIYLLLFHIEELVKVLGKLDNEAIEYNSVEGKVTLSKIPFINREKIIQELGAQTINNDTIEILQVKKIDLLSDESKWDFRLANKPIKAKIVDKEWLRRFHDREVKIQSKDSLKVTLRTTYTFLPNRESTSKTHEIIIVHEIINPSNESNALF